MSMADELGIAPPHYLEAEQAVLGAILIDTDALEMAMDRMQGGEFYRGTHQRIFDAIADLYDQQEPVDLVTITTKLQARGQLEEIGGVTYLAELARAVPTAANIDFYIREVKDKHLLRQVIRINVQHIKQAAENGNVKALVAGMQEASASLALQTIPVNAYRSIGDVAAAVFEGIELRYNNRLTTFGGITGIPSGYSDLDHMTAGFQRSDLIIVAARPSVGKTAFALNVAQNVGIREKETVAIFSLEMGAEQLVSRMVCAEANIDASRIKTGFLEAEDWEKITMAISQLSEAKIFIDDSPSMTVYDIRAKCRQIQREHGLGMVLIDYLQLINGRRRNNGNRQEEVAEISRTLKQIARELGVPVIALSQLSRAVEQRQDKRPIMSDLRESGSIEQDADIVSFLYRDDYYDKESEKKNIIEIILAKQRNGPVGTVELAFLKNFNKFVNLDRTHQEAAAQPAEDKERSVIPDMYRRR